MRWSLWCAATACAATNNATCASSGGGGDALARARALVPPAAEATSGGDVEGGDWWEAHDSLLAAALAELGPRDASVYAPVAGVDFYALPNATATAAPGVYRARLFSADYVRRLALELAHLRASGIPLRRPNGMNRRGCVLSHLGFDGAIEALFATALRPLALRLYPFALRPADVTRHYAFSILYEPEDGGDVALGEHADGSVFTANLCLAGAFAGGDLLFRGVRFHERDADEVAPVAVAQEAGVALLHLGQHLHAAAPTEAGTRENVVFWATGDHDYVRIAPYDAGGGDGKPYF